MCWIVGFHHDFSGYFSIANWLWIVIISCRHRHFSTYQIICSIIFRTTAWAKMLVTPMCREERALENKISSGHMPPSVLILPENANDKCLSISWFFTFFITKTLACVLCLGTDALGGFMFPLMQIGGALGGVIAGILPDFLLRDVVGDSSDNAHEARLCIILGIVGMFTSIYRRPCTSIFVALSVTGTETKGLYPGQVLPPIITAMLTHAMTSLMSPRSFSEQRLLLGTTYESLLNLIFY